MNNLSSLGWNAQLESEHSDTVPHLNPARVIGVDRDSYLVGFDANADSDHLRVSLAGRLRHLGTHDIAVGDWVGLHENRIDHVFARHSSFVRKRAGESSSEQIIAANIDWTLIAMSLNDDFSPRRVERFVVAAWDAGATPVVLLTKCDLVENRSDAVEALVEAAAGCEIIATSALTGEGIDQVRSIIKPGHTAVLVGSSGVGKSTLVNALLGQEVQATAEIRESDAKGRHTTTRRELIEIPDTGGLIIDTPGMREFGVVSSDDGSGGLELGFTDIEDLAAHCGFRDCSHGTEPTCAVLEAIENGEIGQARLDSYFKLKRELAYNERRHDAYKTRQAGKTMSVMVKQHAKHWKKR